MKRRQTWAVVAVALLAAMPATANNLRVANVALKQQDVGNKTVLIEFDLSWDNSWRDALNHDAAWVFAKFRAPGSNEWQHAYLSTNAGAHGASGGLVAVGTSSNAISPWVGVGVFVSSASVQTGSVNYVRTRMKWNYGQSGYAFAKGQTLDVQVLGIEMVCVPQGSFFVGSGGTESGSFTDGGWVSGATLPFSITNEAALTITNASGYLWGTSASGDNSIGPKGVLPADFPKGYRAFYCMKYEITQGQYADFLNLLTQTQSGTRWPNAYGTERNMIQRSGSAGSYTYSAAEAPDRACGAIAWMDGAAYAEWAGLRPMTELEFEKACRGPAGPVANEYAWGTNLTPVSTWNGFIGTDGSGTETVNKTAAELAVGAMISRSFCPADGPPARVGIFATNGANRVSAGASYWGIMEMSGSLSERPVSVGNSTGRAFIGSHGGGALSADGYATQADWPGYTGGKVTGATGIGSRGGIRWPGGGGGIVYARTSDRTFAAMGNTARTTVDYGFRGVRTAP